MIFLHLSLRPIVKSFITQLMFDISNIHGSNLPTLNNRIIKNKKDYFNIPKIHRTLNELSIGKIDLVSPHEFQLYLIISFLSLSCRS